MSTPGPKPSCLCGKCRVCRYRAARDRHYHRTVKGDTSPEYAHRGDGGRPRRTPAERLAIRTAAQKARRERARNPRIEPEIDCDADLRLPGEPDDAELDRIAAEWLKEIRC